MTSLHDNWKEANFENQLEERVCAHCKEDMEPTQSYSIRIPGTELRKFVCQVCWEECNV